MCKKEKVQKYYSEDVVILQKVSQVKSEGCICQKYESTIDELCGMWSYSKVVDLIRELEAWNVSVYVSDPLADPAEVKKQYGIRLVDSATLVDLSAIVVAVGHDNFRETSTVDFRKMCSRSGAVFADLKSIYEKDELTNAGFQPFRL